MQQELAHLVLPSARSIQTVGSKPARAAWSLFLLLSVLAVAGCDKSANDFRRAIRGAATDIGTPRGSGPKSSGDARGRLGAKETPTKEQASTEAELDTKLDALDEPESPTNANEPIRSCPKDAKLTGAAPPRGVAQWCIARAKDGTTIRHGGYRRWHKGAGVKQAGFFQDGKPHGMFSEFYRSGALKETSVFAAGVPDGEFIQYFKDGSKQRSTTFRAGAKSGPYQTWTKVGSPKEKGAYLENEKHGPWQKFYANGQLNSVVTYRSGKKHGKTETYSQEGVLLERGQFNNNIPDGRWITYFDDGRPKSDGLFRAGQRDGQWTMYRRGGDVQSVMVYKGGTVIEQKKAQSAKSSKNGGSTPARRSRSGSFGATDSIGAPAPIPDRGPLPQHSAPQAEPSTSSSWEPM